MTQKIWVLSDTHFGHALMVQTRGFATLEEHDRTIFEAWNETVRDGDTVWHLGDVYFRNGHSWLHALKGDKRVTLGNHDAQKAQILAKAGFKLYGMCEVHGVLLSHMPVNENQLRRFGKNIHGHMHHAKIDDPRYVCVSMEHLKDWKPILLQTAVQQGVL